MNQRLTSLLARANVARRLVTDRVPRHLPVKVARRLVAQANAARDARLYEVAAALFEEALHFTPDNPRLHIQCGHMLKEARHFAAAEEHYGRAQQLMPSDADLALQLGHFYRVSGRPDEAAASYRRALTLNPSWQAAADELALMANGEHGDVRSTEQPEWIVPELLPRRTAAATHPRDAIRILRLGSGRLRSSGGGLKLLRGLEAIRGYCIASVPIEEVRLLLDGVEVGREAMRAFELPNGEGARKYVFNAWHDFSNEQPGRRELSLRFMNTRGKTRVHAETVMVVRPDISAEMLASDAIVPLVPGDPRTVDDQVDTLPSMVRSTRRTPLPTEIRTILVQRVDQLGDLVCSVPAIQRLRDLFPGARIVGLLTSASAELGRSLNIFDEVVIADFPEDPVERRRTMSAEHQIELHGLLTSFSFDIAIDLGEGSGSRPLLLLSGARFLYGFKERDWPWLSAGFEMNARDAINGLETTPPARKLLAMIETLGAMRAPPPGPAARPAAASPPAGYGLAADRPFVVLHTGARLAYSRWPGFPELARMLLARTSLNVAVLADDPAELNLYPQDSRIGIIAGKMPFADFQALLSNAAAFVGNDSGPKHLAALSGTKVVSLHMARLNWSEWGQEGDGIIISRRVPCAGCGIGDDAEDCGKDYACIRHIRAEEVFDAILALLGRHGGSSF